jgi:hypothetical protein
MPRAVHSPGGRVCEERVGVGGPDAQGPVGVVHGADPGRPGSSAAPAAGTRASSPSTMGRTASDRPPAAATGGGATALDEDVDNGQGGRGDGPGVERGGQRRDQQHQRRDKQEHTRCRGSRLPLAVRTRTGCT